MSTPAPAVCSFILEKDRAQSVCVCVCACGVCVCRGLQQWHSDISLAGGAVEVNGYLGVTCLSVAPIIKMWEDGSSLRRPPLLRDCGGPGSCSDSIIPDVTPEGEPDKVGTNFSSPFLPFAELDSTAAI